ncbi:MAG: thiaminase II [Pseudomonadota bacterium]
MSLFLRLKSDCTAEWEAYTRHEFVRGMGDGTLPKACFQHYLIQDYLFLIQFARAYALAVYKADSLDMMRGALDGLKAILEVEMQLHLKHCKEWGLSPAEVERTPESLATLAYTRFVLEAGQSGDLLDLYVALAPCMVGYAEIGSALSANKANPASENPYDVWIDEYASEAYQQIASDTVDLIDTLAEASFTEKRYPKLRELFRQATRLEADFWEMGLRLAP